MNFRIGHGYDVHALAKGESLFLGGILIEHDKGTIAHSDGDVLIHAICDAMLGALALGDIGIHFPNNNDKYKNADSKELLAEVMDLISERNYTLVNIDSTIAMQKPKLKPYIPEMRKILSRVLKTDEDNISIKATTTENLGFEGREEGVSAYAVVLLRTT
jgi:2-C-methyl-D-erythritol 2,4-cyclodiphosphate synthase